MSTFEPKIVELEAQHTIAMHGEEPISGLPEFFGKAFTAVAAAAEAAGVEMVGPPFGYYPVMPTDVVVLEAGVPVSSPVEAAGEVHSLELPACRAVVAVHVGPYDTMEQTYEALQAWMTKADLRPTGPMWESYLSDPAVEPDPSNWRTEIVWPVV